MQNDTQVLGLLTKKIGSADWSKWQVQRWQWYDYVRIPSAAATTANLTFFTTPQGGSDPTSTLIKTLEQTNMVKSSTFGQQYFIVQQIRTHLHLLPKARQATATLTQADFSLDQLIVSERIRQAMQTGVLRMWIGQKEYFDIQQPWRTCPPGFGVSQVIVPFNRATNATGNAYVAQSNTLSDVYALTPPQLIEPEQTFQCQIEFPDLGVDFSAAFAVVGSAQPAYVNAGVILDGYLARPVQ